MARTSNNGGESKTPKAGAKAPARRRSDKARQAAAVVANDSASLTASVAALAANAVIGQPNPAEVQRLAYELYVQRGCCDGYDKEDWYEAERLLRAQH
jgi:hypothetical protein